MGHVQELKNNYDFLTFNYLGQNIFIQNFKGEIKAFQNICLHRFNDIHKEPYGNRVATCLYHYWTYNKKGQVIGMSCKNSFEEDKIKKLELKEFEVQSCGEFIFIKLNSENKITLSEFLGDLYKNIEEFSKHFSSKSIDYNIEHNCNWKLLVENVLECYHCASVHDNSFAKMGYGFIKPEKFGIFKEHSWCEFPKKGIYKEKKIIEDMFNSRTLKIDGYLHFYIYPNAFISSVEGKGFYLGFLFPESVDKTNLRVRYFLPKIEKKLSESDKNIFDFIISSSHDSLNLVLNEDKNIIEGIQKNLNILKDHSPIFGNEEFRINSFYNNFAQKVK